MFYFEIKNRSQTGYRRCGLALPAALSLQRKDFHFFVHNITSILCIKYIIY